MTQNVALYIKDILENMRDAEEFVQGMSARNTLTSPGGKWRA